MRSLKLPNLHVSCTRLVFCVGTIQIFTTVVCHMMWRSTHNLGWLTYLIDYQGAIYFLLLDAFMFGLSLVAWSQFQREDSLRPAWFVITLAMGFLLVGNLLTHLLAVNTYINPLHYLPGEWNTSVAALLQTWGEFSGGSLFMAILAFGLYKALRYYTRIGMLGKLKTFDFLLIGAVGIYSLYVVKEVIQAVQNGTSPIRLSWIITWPNDLLLTILLFEAILLFRTTVEMGGGYISFAWGAFAVAIFLTSLESLAYWLTTYGLFPSPGNAIAWYVWYIWAAVLALGPAYQVDALKMAESRLRDMPKAEHVVCA